MRKIIKSIILIVLIGLCLLQAYFLWTGELQKETEILPLGFDFNSSQETFDDAIYLLTPDRLGIYMNGDADNFTSIKKTSVFYDRIYGDATGILVEAMQEGQLFSKNITYDELFSNRGLFFTMYKSMSEAVFSDVFKVDMDMLSGLEEITSFGIIASDNKETVFFYLIGKDNMAYVYTVDTAISKTRQENIVFYLDQIESASNTLTMYDSTVMDNVNGFSRQVLLPTDENRWSYVEDVYFTIPFISGGGFDDEAVETFINGFEPGTKWTVLQDGRILYGNDNTLMSYTDTGVFTYEMFLESGKTESSLSQAFAISRHFIQKDSYLNGQEYYLKGYAMVDDVYTFYYGYSFNDYPIIMDQQMLSNYDLEHPMVVKVKGDDVICYKRLILTIDDSVQTVVSYNGDYTSVLETFNASVAPKADIDNMFLGYYWNEGMSATMRYILDCEQRYYSIEF